MKKIIFILSLGIISLVQADTQTQFSNKKNKLYETHKKQLIEQAKLYAQEKNKQSKPSDLLASSDTRIDFSNTRSNKK